LQSHQGELLAAIELREVGKYKEAQGWLRNLIFHDPKNLEALTLLSQVLLLDKKTRKQRECKQKLHRLTQNIGNRPLEPKV